MLYSWITLPIFYPFCFDVSVQVSHPGSNTQAPTQYIQNSTEKWIMLKRTKNSSLLWSTVVLGAVVILYLSKIVLGTAAASAEGHEGTCESNYSNSVRQDGDTLLYHFATTSSTQDEAKSILARTEIPSDVTTVVVTAAEQTKGRGTNGREWFGSRGNTFVTICVRQESWLQTKQVMTLLPLKVGAYPSN
jgi:hypothetical protein